jgi:hypothetical protein
VAGWRTRSPSIAGRMLDLVCLPPSPLSCRLQERFLKGFSQSPWEIPCRDRSPSPSWRQLRKIQFIERIVQESKQTLKNLSGVCNVVRAEVLHVLHHIRKHILSTWRQVDLAARRLWPWSLLPKRLGRRRSPLPFPPIGHDAWSEALIRLS